MIYDLLCTSDSELIDVSVVLMDLASETAYHKKTLLKVIFKKRKKNIHKKLYLTFNSVCVLWGIAFLISGTGNRMERANINVSERVNVLSVKKKYGPWTIVGLLRFSYSKLLFLSASVNRSQLTENWFKLCSIQAIACTIIRSFWFQSWTILGFPGGPKNCLLTQIEKCNASEHIWAYHSAMFYSCTARVYQILSYQHTNILTQWDHPVLCGLDIKSSCSNEHR